MIYVIFFSKWQEIGDAVWCCPIKLKSAIGSSSTKTILVGNLLLAFYSKEELAGKRLHELDQKVVEAIIGNNILFLTSGNSSLRGWRRSNGP